MVNVILLAPLYGNGGIASWTKKYIDTFPTEEFKINPLFLLYCHQKICKLQFMKD